MYSVWGNAQLAQDLGKPKREIGTQDWETLHLSWKIPSLISTTLDCGWRAEMVGRLECELANLDTGQVMIPSSLAVKNDKKWIFELSSRSTRILSKWLRQRANRPKYDENDEIWLNRRGNPYNSATLNNILQTLIEDAGIQDEGRKLTWHSIRHSTGRYVYNQEKDLGLVAEVLRHVSLDSARKYPHPTPETKEEVVESIQGGVSL